MISVKAPEGNIALMADRLSECPWCKKEWVFLCRQKPEGQWIPAQKEKDSKEIHEIHRCQESITQNKTLRVLLQLEYDEKNQNLSTMQ